MACGTCRSDLSSSGGIGVSKSTGDTTERLESTVTWPAWICLCPVQDQVRNRLSRPDAVADPVCARRLEYSMEYGPVVRFALQLLEAARVHARSLSAAVNTEDVRSLDEEPCPECGRYYQMFPYAEDGTPMAFDGELGDLHVESDRS